MSKEKDLKMPEASPFKLATDSGFGSRADDIFANLGHIEAKHNAYQKARSHSRDGRDDDKLIKEDPNDDPWSRSEKRPSDGPSRPSRSSDCEQTSDRSHHGPDDHNRGFKRPRNPPLRPKSRPDHQLHPDKYTYYNLEDVSPDSMSDKSNTATAISFLSSLDSEGPEKKLKTDHQHGEVEGKRSEGASKGAETKIVFNKPQRKNTEESKDGNSTVHIAGRSGCLVMPEYVIGQKPTSKKSKTKKSVPTKAKNTVAIGHIMDECDDDDDEDDLSLTPMPTRTVFSGCMVDDNEDEPMDIEHGSHKKGGKSIKNRAIRSHRHSDSDEDDRPASVPSLDVESPDGDTDLDGVD